MSNPEDNPHTTKINGFTILLATIGFFASLYALVLHIQSILKPGHGSLCDINATISCSNVIGSSYGTFASIPLGSYGMAFFMALLSLSLMPKYSAVTKKQLATLEFVAGLLGFMVVLVLMFISYKVLGLMCPTCSIIHAVIILYTIQKTLAWNKIKKDPKIPFAQDSLMRLMSVIICMSIPPLASGVVAPIVVTYFSSENPQGQSQTETETETLQNTDTSAMLKFNKSNYIGDGEDYRRGSDQAKVIIQMFSDFGCPHCRAADEDIIKAQDTIGKDKVLFVYRFFPLSGKCNAYMPSEGSWYPSCELAEAARCAGQQKLFWKFKDWAFSGQDWSEQLRSQKFSMDGFKKEIENLSGDPKSFEQCINSGVEKTKIKNDIELANQYHIEGTPLIFINGIKFYGQVSTEKIINAIEKQL